MDADEIRHIAVVGTGTIGISWAALFLANGFDVTATDVRPEAEAALRSGVDQTLRSLDRGGKTSRKGVLRFCASLEDCCRHADFVQENAIEREPEKLILLSQIDAVVRPDVVIASSTSAISITAIQKASRRPQRIVLGHPFNPPHLIPLVELAGGEQTEEWAIDLAEHLYSRLGKATIRLNREIYGHVANRLQAAIFREAIHLLESGVASAEDIDKAVTEGPGLRWALMGPFLTYHLAGGRNGIRGFMQQFAPLQQRLWAELGEPNLDSALQALVVEAVDKAVAGRNVAEIAADRDRRLQALLIARSARAQTEGIGP